MKDSIELRVPHFRIHDEAWIRKQLDNQVTKNGTGIGDYKLVRKSIDARKKVPEYLLRFVYNKGDEEVYKRSRVPLKSDAQTVHIVGAGPAGYYAALRCLELGLRPIVLERGKDVRARRRDLRAIQQFSKVDPDSNYCFGEGGAGTYSDGKLYTRSKKKGDLQKVLQVLVDHGAKTDILTEAHPHIGSNKLPGIISNMRQSITDGGGEVRFYSKVTDLVERKGQIAKLVVNNDEVIPCDQVVLATGHSSRDIFQLLSQKDWEMRFKPFALGVRIEHPQGLIDDIQYRCGWHRPETLPAASYNLAHSDRLGSVYSFCMCPGGLVVPAATAEGEIVLNGMSLSRRDSPFSNAGTVVAVDLEQLGLKEAMNPMVGLDFQSAVERKLFKFGDGSMSAPSQRLVDFCEGKSSTHLPDTSYIPGNYSAPLHSLLPDFVVNALQHALPIFGRKMKGYYTNDAVVMGTESRTSSPITIPRDKNTLMHTQISGLFPCGEGAGFAGGIVSAAIDGMRVAEKISEHIKQRG